jgi:hypothetical protein
MNQICTNKKQSSRLLEAGIRPETADMYLDEFECPVAFEYRRIEGHVGQDMAFPAWSLSKLIDMMPKSYQDDIDGMVYYLSGNFVELMYASDKIEDEEGDKTYTCANSFNKESLMDNVVDAIEWLIREGHLNKKFLSVKCGDCRLIEDEDTNGEAWCAFHQKTGKGDGEACSNLLGKGAQNE